MKSTSRNWIKMWNKICSFLILFGEKRAYFSHNKNRYKLTRSSHLSFSFCVCVSLFFSFFLYFDSQAYVLYILSIHISTEANTFIPNTTTNEACIRVDCAETWTRREMCMRACFVSVWLCHTTPYTHM